MSFIVDVKKSNYVRETLPAGSYQGVCYSIIDLGTQFNNAYQNRNRKVRISREIQSEMRTFDEKKGEQPLALHKEYTLSFGEKATLAKDLRSWRGHDLTAEEETNGFDISTLIGENCLLSVGIIEGKDGNKYNVINSISPLIKGMEKQTPKNKTIVWTLTEGRDSTFDAFPEFLQKKIWESQERSKKAEITRTLDEDLPF